MKTAEEMYSLSTRDRAKGAKKVLGLIEPEVRDAARAGLTKAVVNVDMSVSSHDAFTEALFQLRRLGYSASMKDEHDQRDGDYCVFTVSWAQSRDDK